jgi:hypothetical protein
MKLRLIGAAMLALVCAGTAANAKPRHDSAVATGCVYGNTAVIVCPGLEYHTTERPRVSDANGNGAGVIGGRPSGCPYQFCGCEASLYVFGEIRKDLNLAENWIKKFPHAHPAPGMAAARKHHVMVLVRHIEGDDWLVHDGNSGGHKTREHVRSIAGYVIVDPRARSASND